MRKTIKLRVEKPEFPEEDCHRIRGQSTGYIPLLPNEVKDIFGSLPRGEVFDLELELKAIRRVR